MTANRLRQSTNNAISLRCTARASARVAGLVLMCCGRACVSWISRRGRKKEGAAGAGAVRQANGNNGSSEALLFYRGSASHAMCDLVPLHRHFLDLVPLQ